MMRTAAAVALLLSAPVAVAQPHPLPPPAVSEIKDDFTFAAVGDLLGPRRPIRAFAGPAYETVGKLLAGADAAFGNLEATMFDLKATPANGVYGPRADAATAAELKALGFDLLSRANNHAFDYELAGLEATSQVLDAAGLVHAGVGADLGTARAPAFYESAKGRVALVATASTYQAGASAGPGGDRSVMRPGASVIRNTEVHLVTEAEMGTLRALQRKRGWPADGKDLLVGDTVFRIGDRAGVTYEINPADRREVVAAVREAEQKANFVVFSIHANQMAAGDCSHDNGLPLCDSAEAGDFLQPLFHEAIDAGADQVVRHGPHRALGVEIYRGKPIFYGLGSFYFFVGPGQRVAPDGAFRMPQTWYDSYVAVSQFRGGKVSEIRIYPVTLQEDGDNVLRGMPRLATGADAQRILKRLVEDSAPYGTHVRIENDVGVIRPGAAS